MTATLVAHLWLIVGAPVPTSILPSGDRSTSFACQSRRCGCAVAGRCLDSCCCSGIEVQAAWSNRPLLSEPTIPDLADATTEREPASCCSTPAPSVAGCCSAPSDADCRTDCVSTDTDRQDEDSSSERFFAALQCQGEPPADYFSSIVLVIVEADSIERPRRADWNRLFTFTYSAIESDLLTPPPRSVS